MPLTDEQVERYEAIRAMYDDDAAEAAKAGMIVAPPPAPQRQTYPETIEPTGPSPGTVPRLGGAPPIETPYRSPMHHRDLTEQAVKMQTQNLIQQGYIDRGAAEEQARRNVAAATAKAVDVHQREQPYASKRRIEELSGLDAVVESLKQQPLRSAEQTKRREQEVQTARRSREEILDRIDASIDSGVVGDEREKERLDKFHEYLRKSKAPLMDVAERRFRREIGVDADPNTTDVEALGQKMWMDWIKDIAPELYKEERNYWEATKDTASAAFKWTMESVEEERGGRFEPGTVVETPFATVLRDLVGTLRFVVDPIAQWTTWEVDSRGNPIDPEDWALKIADQMPDWYKGLPAVPFQPSTRTWADQERPAIETGDLLRDIAYSIATNRMVGDDLMALPAYQKAWEKLGFPNAPWWIGLGAEVAIPISAPAKLAWAPVKGVAATAKYTERLAQGTAIANGASKAAQVAEAVADPMIVLRAKHADWAARKMLHNVPGAETFEGGARATETARVLGDAVADATVAPQVVLRHLDDVSGPYVDPSDLSLLGRSSVVQQAVAKATNAAGKIEKTKLKAALSAHLAKMQGLAESNKLTRPVQRALEIGAQSLKAVDPIVPIAAQASRYASALVKTGMKGAPAVDVEFQALSMVASNSVRSDLLDWAPRLFGETIMQGRNVLTKKAWDTVGKDVTARVTKILEHRAAGSVKIFDEPQMLAEHVLTAVGPEVVRQSKVWTKIVDKLKAGKPLHEIDYRRVHTEVQGRVIREAVEDSVELQWGGRAYAAAMVPEGRRIQTMRTADEVLQHAVVRGLETGAKFAPDLKVWEGASKWLASGRTGTRFNFDPARTPLVVAKFMEATNARLVNVIADMKADIVAKQKKYAGMGREKAAERAIQETIDEAVDAVETNIRGNPSETRTFLAWVEMAKKFFGRVPISETDIKRALGLDPKTGSIKNIEKLTPKNFANFLGKIRESDPLLRASGLKTTLWTSKITDPAASDNIFAAFSAFIAEQRAQKMVRAEVAKFVETNPAFKIQLHHPLEMTTQQTRKMIEGSLTKHTPPRSTPGVAPGTPTPATLKHTRTTVVGELLTRLENMGRPVGGREWLQSILTAIRRGRTLTGGEIKHIDKTLRAHGMTEEARLFAGGPPPGRQVSELDKITAVTNNHLRRVSEVLTPDERLHLVRMAFERKIATGDINAVPHDVNQMTGAIGQLLHDDITRGVLKDAGVSVDYLDAANWALKDTVWRGIARDADAQVRGLMRDWGFVAGDKVTDVAVGLKPQIFEMAAAKPGAFFAYGPDYAELAGRLQKAVKSGGLDDALDNIRAMGDEKLTDLAWRSIKNFGDTFNRIAISGMLGGIVTPITRFHGLNFVTAPAIAVITSGWNGMRLATGIDLKANSLLNWAAVRYGAKADEVVFVSDSGIKWTRRAIEDAIERNNVKFSQVSYEFHGAVIGDIMRAAKTDKNMAGVAARADVMRWIDPRNKNFWNGLAEQTDNYWRKNIFIGALKEGKGELEAAKMAQNVLLDYGAVNKAEKNVVARYVLFWAFRRQIISEVIDEVLRGGNKLRQLTAWHAYQHQHSRSWAYDKDYHKSRLYTVMGPTFDQVAQSGIYGPGDPGLEALNDIVNVSMWVMNWRQGVTPTAIGFWEGAKDVAFTPEIRFLQEMVDYGPDEKSAGYVPPHQVAALMEFGAWEHFRNFFREESGNPGIEAVPMKRRRAGDPTFNGFQYQFTNKDVYNKYLLYTAALTRLGIMRTVDDIAKGAVAGGLAPEGAEMKGLAEPSPVLHAMNIQTAMNTSSENRVRLRAMQKVERELLIMSREGQP